MPLRDFSCEACGLTQERYYGPGVDPACACGGRLEMLPLSARISKTAVFPYVHPHLTGDGKPVVVESLGHLRALERKYGKVVHAFSQDSVDSPRDLPEERPGGREWEGDRWWKRGRR